ncbi:hypothetical protein ACFLSX_05460, partial [Calditrichota bacterium]
MASLIDTINRTISNYHKTARNVMHKNVFDFAGVMNFGEKEIDIRNTQSVNDILKVYGYSDIHFS